MGKEVGLANQPLTIMLGSGLMLSEALAGPSPMSSSEDDCHPGSFGQHDVTPVACKAHINSTSSLESYSKLEHAFAAMSLPSPTHRTSKLSLAPAIALPEQCCSPSGEHQPSLIALSPCCPAAMQRSSWCLNHYDLLALLHTGDSSHVHRVSRKGVRNCIFFIGHQPLYLSRDEALHGSFMCGGK